MHVVIAPDSFKGSATATQVARAIADGLHRIAPDVSTTLVPMADGGEGTVEAVLGILGGTAVEATVRDPLDRPVRATFGWVEDRRLAVIEMAAASGLPLLAPDHLDPGEASSYGTGELIRAALDQGAESIILGIGGSATVDGGSGLLAALGIRFLDADGNEVRGAGGHLGRIARIDVAGLDGRARAVPITLASDVSSPLLGPTGAIHVFGPQKGVAADALDAFEAGMAHFADVVVRTIGADRRDEPGSGAAGGMGFGVRCFLDARYRDGFSLIAELSGLVSLISAADLVITGEGRLDAQSLVGKVPVSVARMAKAAGVPALALAGQVEGDLAALRAEGLAAVMPIVDRPMTLQDAMDDGVTLIERAAARLMAILEVGGLLAGKGPVHNA